MYTVLKMQPSVAFLCAALQSSKLCLYSNEKPQGNIKDVLMFSPWCISAV